jgi:hypothetical protein
MLTRGEGWGENREAIDTTLVNLGIIDGVKRWFYGHTHVPQETNCGKHRFGQIQLLQPLTPKNVLVTAVTSFSQNQILLTERGKKNECNTNYGRRPEA